jgi:hypothetical protein
MEAEKPIYRTSDRLEGPYLVLWASPPGSTPEQGEKAFEAAARVFAEAGVDPVEIAHSDDPDWDSLWVAAEKAATDACWAPRPGTPLPCRIGIYEE